MDACHRCGNTILAHETEHDEVTNERCPVYRCPLCSERNYPPGKLASAYEDLDAVIAKHVPT